MATIKTAISLYDGVTGPAQSMVRAMNLMLNSFENVQRASGNAVDVTSLQEAREEMAKADTAFEAIEERIQAANSAQKQFKGTVFDSITAADGLLAKLKAVAAAVGAGTVIQNLVELSDSMTSTQARLSLMVDDGGSVDELEAKIMASANRSRAAYQSTAAAVAKLGLTAGDAFANNDELVTFSELVNKQFTIAGTTSTEASAAMLQLTQAMASGVLRGDELNSIFEQAPTIIQSIADYLDVPIGQIRSMASEGELTADIVKNAMFAAADDINNKFESMPMTWGQVFTAASNMGLQALSPLLDGVNWLANNISIIGPAVLGLGGAFAVFQIAANWTKIASAAAAIYNGVVNLLTIGFGVLTGSTTAAKRATELYHSVLLANPITWVVMLIMVLIAALYAGVAAYNKFAGASVSATGIITGAFAVLGAYLLDGIILLQNVFANLANFIGNVFNNPAAAVEVLFYDMCLTVLGYIKVLAQGIEDLLNKIPGVTVDITSGLDSFYAGLEEAKQKVEDESGWVEYVQKMDFIDYSDAASAGYKLGEGIASKISGALGLGDATDAYSLGNALDGIYSNTGDTAANTAATADSLDILDEDLAYLRDIAEREAINRYTTAEIKVEQHNENHIASGMDVDGIMDAWTADFAEKLEVSAEGVHT